MNRFILRHGTPVTVIILAIFAWVIYRRVVDGGISAIVLLSVAAGCVWILGTFLFISFWPLITVNGIKRTLCRRGLGGGPIPVNRIYAVPERPSRSASTGSLIATGADDLLYLGGWLDVRAAPRVLHVPEMRGRYFSVQFIDPNSGANFAYVGKRTTGTHAADFLLCTPSWESDPPDRMIRIDVPHQVALLVGRVFVADEQDRKAAYALAGQVQLAPLGDARQR